MRARRQQQKQEASEHEERIGIRCRIDRNVDRRKRSAGCSKRREFVQEVSTVPLRRPDARNKIGPELNGLDGRKAGTVPNYSYSDANKNSGLTWDEATFKEYIKDPRAKIPGTKMTFPGIKNEQEINDLWAYLKQFDASGNVK